MSPGGLRERWGECFITRFPTVDIPWKPLSLGDFLQYSADIQNAFVPQYILEEEIFKKCVQDPKIAKDLSLPAGVVPVTVSTIFALSGPASIDAFNEEMALAREATAKPLYEFVVLICQAFPGYTPRDILDMPYPEFMKTLAMAERVLLSAKVLQEPLFLRTEGAKRKKRPQDLKKEWQKSQELQKKTMSVEEALEQGETALKQGKEVLKQKAVAVTTDQIVADNFQYQISSAERKGMEEEARNLFPYLFKDKPVDSLATDSLRNSIVAVDPEERVPGGKAGSGKIKGKKPRRRR